jgi:hypothetical protein
MKINYALVGEKTNFANALLKVFQTSFGTETNKELYRLQKKIAEKQKYYNINKKKIFQTHGEKKGDRQTIQNSPEGMKEYIELQQEVFEIDADPIEIPEDKLENLRDFSPNDRIIIEKLVKFVERPQDSPEPQKKGGR